VKFIDNSFSNSNFEQKVNLISFEGVETTEELQIVIQSQFFENLSFLRGGNLFDFKQQMKYQLLVENSRAISLKGAEIHFEAYNKNNLMLPTRVKLQNFTADFINALYDSFLYLEQGSQLEIVSSSFTNINWYEEGAVIFAGFMQTLTIIHDSVFENNTAIQGGVFYIDNISIIRCYNCTLRNNFAIEGGIIRTTTNGFFELHNTRITQNYALSAAMIDIFNSGSFSYINHWDISNNTLLSREQVLSEINGNWNRLCFFSEDYKNFLKENDNVIYIMIPKYWISSVAGRYYVQNDTRIYNQINIMQGFGTNITIQDSTISNVEMSQELIKLGISTIDLMNVTITNISGINQTTSSIVHGLIGSRLTIMGVKFMHNTVGIANMMQSYGGIMNLVATNVSWNGPLLTLTQIMQMMIGGLNISSVNTNSELIRLQQSFIPSMSNVVITNINQIVFRFISSALQSMENITISNWYQAIKASQK
jgi:hypothetical protein